VREWASVVPLCAMAIFMGVAPVFFTAPMGPSVKKVVERVQDRRSVTVDNSFGSSDRAVSQRSTESERVEPTFAKATVGKRPERLGTR